MNFVKREVVQANGTTGGLDSLWQETIDLSVITKDGGLSIGELRLDLDVGSSLSSQDPIPMKQTQIMGKHERNW